MGLRSVPYTLTFKPDDGNAQKIIKKALLQP